jgi:hypothetical protein
LKQFLFYFVSFRRKTMPAVQNWAETARTIEFEKAVEFELNERPGKLRPMAQQYTSQASKKQITDRFSDMEAEEIEGRNTDTNNTDTSIERRWIHKPKSASVAPMLDRDDKLSTEVNIGAALPIGVAKAIRRYQDNKWLEGFYGTAFTGEEGTVQTAFKSANVIAADFGETSTDYVGLTLAKMKKFIKLANQQFVDLEDEQLNLIITAEEVEDLLGINEYISRDYNPLSQKQMSKSAEQALQDGKPTPFLGIMFWPCELTNPKAYKRANALGLTTNGSGHRRLPGWVNSGMAFCTWEDMTTEHDIRADKNHSEQFAAYTCGRASRVHEDKCFIIETVD